MSAFGYYTPGYSVFGYGEDDAGSGSSVTYSVSGGVSFGGEASIIRGLVFDPSGGIALSGTVPFIRSQVLEPAGGLSFAGSAPRAVTKIFDVAGGLVLGGSASFITHLAAITWSVTGGVIFGGAGAWVTKVFSFAKVNLPFLTHAGGVSASPASSPDQNVVSE